MKNINENSDFKEKDIIFMRIIVSSEHLKHCYCKNGAKTGHKIQSRVNCKRIWVSHIFLHLEDSLDNLKNIYFMPLFPTH